jgi:hypothetical protein
VARDRGRAFRLVGHVDLARAAGAVGTPNLGSMTYGKPDVAYPMTDVYLKIEATIVACLTCATALYL